MSDMSAEEVIKLERQLLCGELNETASDIGAVMMKVHVNIFGNFEFHFKYYWRRKYLLHQYQF